jgi:hypothetical protein
MLRYDPEWLIEWYRDETPAAPGLPYALLDRSGPYRAVRSEEPFVLCDVTGMQPRLPFDESVARLAAYEDGTLQVQRARYSDGVKSNYAVDGPGALRDVLRRDYGAKLPPLADARLSNGIGLAVVVWDGDGRPYLPRRAPGQAVYAGGFHCTASGETQWPQAAKDFDEVFTAQICRELEEEAGLARSDLEWIRPLALCREFLRAGKPQFFFAARTVLTAEELAGRRRAAIAAQIERGRLEILDEVLEEVNSGTIKECTMECVANLALFGGME